ncbi:hypothetical protein FQR65_LT05339 [Abscondita terminalis]|nr:hypothetical protein FQR65_LT05339 [Abscondita terminalis]
MPREGYCKSWVTMKDSDLLHDNAVELAKVIRLLIAVDQGHVKKFPRKSLKQISMEDLPKVVEDAEEEDDSDGANGNCNSNELNINMKSNVLEGNRLFHFI